MSLVPLFSGAASRSLLNPVSPPVAALGHLPVTHSSRVSAKSPSASTPADAALWAAYSLGPRGLGHSLWGCEPSGSMVGDSHFLTTEISVSTCPAQGKAALVGLYTPPPQDGGTHNGQQQHEPVPCGVQDVGKTPALPLPTVSQRRETHQQPESQY